MDTAQCGTPEPQLASLLIPSLPNEATVEKGRERRLKDSIVHNKRHRVRDLPQLSPGQSVWITDTKSEGTRMSWRVLQESSSIAIA